MPPGEFKLNLKTLSVLEDNGGDPSREEVIVKAAEAAFPEINLNRRVGIDQNSSGRRKDKNIPSRKFSAFRSRLSFGRVALLLLCLLAIVFFLFHDHQWADGVNETLSLVAAVVAIASFLRPSK